MQNLHFALVSRLIGQCVGKFLLNICAGFCNFFSSLYIAFMHESLLSSCVLVYY